jgi:hypothetical protein
MAKSKTLQILRVGSGNFFEMYDFMIFGYYASYIGPARFEGPRGAVTRREWFLFRR